MGQLSKYVDVKRIPVEGIPRIGKDYLSDAEVEELLGPGRKVVQEKIDGKSDWEMVRRAQVFFEYCKIRHSVPYTHLPSWKIAFDVWDTVNDHWADPTIYRFLERKWGWNFAPILVESLFTLELHDLLPLLKTYSAYSPYYRIEGIVIKNYDIPLFGKIVNPEFEEMVREGVHPLKRRVIEFNTIKYWSKI